MDQKFGEVYRKVCELERGFLLRNMPPSFSSYDVSRGTTRDGRRVLIFCSNDYLGMTKHPEVLRKLKEGVDMFGGGAGASRLVSGNFASHERFEELVMNLLGLEAKGKGVLCFNSGWSANVGVISALCDSDSEIFSDELNHASIIDGCRLSRAKVTVFPHRDIDYLENFLRKSKAKFKLVVTDSVFSMDGTIAPLRDLFALCERYGAVLYVDEAHAFGVFGNGRGLCEDAGVEADVALYTLSKAAGLCGAFVVAPWRVIEYIRSRARSFIFSTALPPYVYEAAMASVEIILREHELRRKLWSNVHLMLHEIRRRIGEGVSTSSQIIPFVVGDEFKTLSLSRTLLEMGVFVQAIRYPSVPRGTARLRITVTAVHSKEEIETFGEIFSEAIRRCGLDGNAKECST